MAVGRVPGGRGNRPTGGATRSDKTDSTSSAGGVSGTRATSGTSATTATSGAQAPAGVVGSSATKSVEPLSLVAQELVKEMNAGKISRDEARLKLISKAVRKVNREQLRIDSKKLDEKVETTAGEDPGVRQLVDRILSKA